MEENFLFDPELLTIQLILWLVFVIGAMIYIYIDAKRRNLNPRPWLLLTLCSPLISVIGYSLFRFYYQTNLERAEFTTMEPQFRDYNQEEQDSEQSTLENLFSNFFNSSENNMSQMQLQTRFNLAKQKICSQCGAPFMKDEKICSICGNSTFFE